MDTRIAQVVLAVEWDPETQNHPMYWNWEELAGCWAVVKDFDTNMRFQPIRFEDE